MTPEDRAIDIWNLAVGAIEDGDMHSYKFIKTVVNQFDQARSEVYEKVLNIIAKYQLNKEFKFPLDKIEEEIRALKEAKEGDTK